MHLAGFEPMPPRSNSIFRFSLSAKSSQKLKLCRGTKSTTLFLLSLFSTLREVEGIYFRYLFPVLDQLENFFFQI